MNSPQEVTSNTPKSGVVVHNPDLCRGCFICELACSAYQEGQCSSFLSRIHVNAEDLDLNFPAVVCAQCSSPSCYFACPLKDSALRIDTETGARYINEDECTGCGECAQACPLPGRPIWSKQSGTFFKCDLCQGRKGGPICVEMCPRKALTFVVKGN